MHNMQSDSFFLFSIRKISHLRAYFDYISSQAHVKHRQSIYSTLEYECLPLFYNFCRGVIIYIYLFFAYLRALNSLPCVCVLLLLLLVLVHWNQIPKSNNNHEKKCSYTRVEQQRKKEWKREKCAVVSLCDVQQRASKRGENNKQKVNKKNSLVEIGMNQRNIVEVCIKEAIKCWECSTHNSCIYFQVDGVFIHLAGWRRFFYPPLWLHFK